LPSSGHIFCTAARRRTKVGTGLIHCATLARRAAYLIVAKQGATVKKEFTLRWNDAKPGNIKRVRYGDREAVFSVTDTGKASVRKYRCVTKPWED